MSWCAVRTLRDCGGKEKKMPRSWSLALILGLILAAGCVPAIETSLQQEAGPRVSFAELSAHPDPYKGQLTILGGEVMSVTPWEQGSLLMVDQRQLDERLYPVGAASGGTFLVESDEWLTSTQYLPKSKVVVAGVVKGRKDGWLLLKARQVTFLEPPTWEKYYYPVPREWYPPELEHWYTPPYFDIYRGGGRR
jgi:starvation-inducible outer membrane lipoprotein